MQDQTEKAGDHERYGTNPAGSSSAHPSKRGWDRRESSDGWAHGSDENLEGAGVENFGPRRTTKKTKGQNDADDSEFDTDSEGLPKG